MKLILLAGCLLLAAAATAQNSSTALAAKTNNNKNLSALSDVQGLWMYGNFSTKEYWSKNPNTYLGNAFSMAIAFVFKADGTYEQYFTSQATNITGATYHQSFTKGSYTVDANTRTIVTTARSSHYKRTRSGVVEEDRDMRPEEIAKKDSYTYTTGTEPNGTKAIYLTPKGAQKTLAFLQKG